MAKNFTLTRRVYQIGFWALCFWTIIIIVDYLTTYERMEQRESFIIWNLCIWSIVAISIVLTSGFIQKKIDLLETSKENFERIFNHFQDVFYQTDKFGIINMISPSIKRYCDYTPEEVIGKNVRDFYADESERQKLLKELLTNDEVNDFEIKIKTKRNKIIFTSVTSHLIKNELGETIGIEGILHDRTLQKLMEEETKKLYRAVHCSPTSVVITDSQGKIEYVNPKFENVTGYSFEEAVGQNPRILKSGNKSPEEYNELWQAILSGKEWRGEFKNKKKSGELYWELASISPVKNEEGDITNFVAIKEDITERKEIEEKLKLSEEKINLLVNSMEDIVFTLDCDEKFTGLYGQWIKRANLSSDFFFGKTALEIFGDEIGEVHHLANQKALLAENVIYDWTFISTFEEAIIQTSLSPIRDKNNSIIGILGVGREITELRVLENELRSKNIELESAVEKLTSMQNQLVQSEKMASIGQLTAGIAHEINNPLGYISSNLNRLQEYYDDLKSILEKWHFLIDHPTGIKLDEQINSITEFENKLDLEFLLKNFQTLLNVNIEGVCRISKIVKNMRAFSHISGGKLEPVNINKILDEVLLLIWNEIKYKAEVKRDFNEIPNIFGDCIELQQVFTNIIMNSVQAISDHGVIAIRTFAEDANITIEIKDNGCGIDDKIINKIFDPFYTTKKVGQGTGLGLWITKSIVEKNKGSISVQSKINEGTEFKISFPNIPLEPLKEELPFNIVETL